MRDRQPNSTTALVRRVCRQFGNGTLVTALLLAGASTASLAQTSSWSSRVEGGPTAAPVQPPGTVVLPKAAIKPRVLDTPLHQQTLRPPPAMFGTRADPKGATALRKGNPNPPPAKPASTNLGTDPAYLAFDSAQFHTALKLAEAEAAKGDAVAHTLVARIHAEGHGVRRDPVLAAKWYHRAAELGDPEAAFALALLFTDGRTIKKDMPAAATMFERAAAQGHVWANYNLGMMFLSGHGKPENPIRGAQHIAYAAEKGVPAAQYDLATLYISGHGVPNDGYLASRWLKRAAEQGMPEAQFDYAMMLLKGQGLNEDRADALRYLRAAAEAGLAAAQNRLAHALLDGVGGNKSPREAAKWRIIARDQGLADDKLDAVVRRLPAADRAAAEIAATQWQDRAIVGGGLH